MIEDSIEKRMPRSRELIELISNDLQFDPIGFHISFEKSLTALIIDAYLLDGFYIAAKRSHVPIQI